MVLLMQWCSKQDKEKQRRFAQYYDKHHVQVTDTATGMQSLIDMFETDDASESLKRGRGMMVI